MTHSYGLMQYTESVDFSDGYLILPDGGRIYYVRISDPSLPWFATVFEAQFTPTRFYKSRIIFNGNAFEVQLKDGTVYVMGHAAPLQRIRDRYGNETRLTWSETNIFGAGHGNLMRITSPNGRWIEFSYYADTGRVSQAKDNIGRTVHLRSQGPRTTGRTRLKYQGQDDQGPDYCTLFSVMSNTSVAFGGMIDPGGL